MYVLSQMVDKSESLLKNKEEIYHATLDLMKNENALFSGRKASRSDIQKRIDKFEGSYSSYVR